MKFYNFSYFCEIFQEWIKLLTKETINTKKEWVSSKLYSDYEIIDVSINEQNNTTT